ncbi:signal recognition particle-docking protein FtsY [Neisseria subflava]|uniref:signal recognition particle-docking protein FtsY n=1 Tax=Neisseria subflava TaxID=28449 RepID=UPI001F16C151|nr:signal recognition particle-docking protein FtsY [Neisseria subflava]
MFSFFRRKKKQETPAPEEAQVQETAAKVESEVAQVVENIKEDAESLAESVKGHVESVVESAVETVSETVEQVREALTETPFETVEKVEEHVEAAKEATVETASEAVDQIQEAVAEMPSEAAEVAEEVAEQAEAAKETAVETVREAVEQIQETVAEMPSEAADAVEEAVEQAEAAKEAAEQAEAVKEEAVEAVSETVEQAQEAVSETPVEAPAPVEEPKLSWAARLKQGLTKSRDKMAKSLAGVFGGGQIDEDLYEELETVLITSDMGMEATEYLMKDVRDRVSLKGLKDGNELRGALKDALYDLIKPLEKPLTLPETKEPFVIMLAGINGAGKTTSIGKLAKYFQAQGKSVLLAAGDTFRAAAREQLQAWGERNNVTVISQTTGDSAAVCFDAVQAAKARGIDIVLADTAGRLPTQLHLMEEIKKVKRVLQKAMPDAPHEIIVVLDANIGQNAVNQVKAFDEVLGLTGLIVTKLDGTAKGGILAALASDRPVPVRYIGVGEGIDDLRPFNAKAFVDALLD